MSLTYRAVDWNRHKRYYDTALAVLVLVPVAVYTLVTLWRSPEATAETLVIRSCALAAILLLHITLCIGPLARLNPQFLPFLYNRRHLGVTVFSLGLVHAGLAVFQFHALGNDNPLISTLTAYGRDYQLRGVGDISHFPFEIFGACALAILFLMAATSHDFWLKNLGASIWKALHLGVYLAYGLLIAHVLLGVFQYERSAIYPILLGAGFLVVAGLHLAAALKESRCDRLGSRSGRSGMAEVCATNDLLEGRGKVVVVEGTRIAIFRHRDCLFATSNVCRHQGGPIGEGRIVDDCITCPWHGWNYRPEDGCSPPPFHEVLKTYEVQVVAGRVWVKRTPNPLGTRSSGVQTNQ